MMTFKYTFRMVLVAFIFISIPSEIFGQDRIYGDFGGGWSSNSWLTQTFGTSYMYSEVPSSTGNKYFRYMQSTTSPWTQWGPNNGCNGDAQTGQGSNYQCANCSDHALYVNVTSTTNRWVFKTKNLTDGLTFCFDIGTTAIADISSYTTDYSDPLVGNVITISLNGNQLAGNQGVYLRYTTDNWTSSTISEMTFSSNKYEVNITSSDVTANSTIEYYFFVSKSGIAANITAADADLYTIAWNNNSGSNFQIKPVDFVYDNGSWNPTSPTFASNKDVLIADDVTITSDAIVADVLYFRDDATMTLDNGASPTSTSYSQLQVAQIVSLDQSIIGVTQEQYLGTAGHHGISSPMTAGFGSTSGTATALYEYDATSNGVYVGSYVSNGTATTSTVGRGFFAPVGSAGDFLSSAGNFSVSGLPNTSHNWTLGHVNNNASGASDHGWNLIGNPYSATLDWSSVSVGSSVNGAVYVWDPSNSQYMSWTSAGGGVNGGSQYIPPMQAFWVQTSSGGTGTDYDISTTMSSNTTTSQSPTFQKTQNDRIKLSVINLSDNTKNDEAVIAHSPGSADGFDGNLDAWKLDNYGGNPNIYSVYAGDRLAINAVDLSIPKVITLGIDVPQSRDVYQLAIEQFVNGDTYDVILEDKHLNTFTDISNAAYSFQFSGSNNGDTRFNLHINGTNGIGVEEHDVINNFIYQLDNEVFIHADKMVFSTYELWTIDGRLLQEGVIHSSITHFSKPQSGLYLVQLKGNTANKTIKTFLK